MILAQQNENALPEVLERRVFEKQNYRHLAWQGTKPYDFKAKLPLVWSNATYWLNIAYIDDSRAFPLDHGRSVKRQIHIAFIPSLVGMCKWQKYKEVWAAK